MKKILMCLVVVSFIFTLNFNVSANEIVTLEGKDQSENVAGKNDGKIETLEGYEEKIPTSNNGSSGNQYNNYKGVDVVCGNGVYLSPTLVNVSYYFILIFQVAAPIIIVLYGSIDLARGLMAGKDDEIKKGQATFFKRLIAGVMLFLVITIAKLVLNVFAGESIIECVNCFLNGANSCR